MSRHRDIRNLNIHDQLDDDALSDGGEDVLTEEQQVALEESLVQVREILGDENVSGVSDDAIRDALWHLYFDVEQTIHWLIEEEERKAIARERKDKNLPPLPGDRQPDWSSSSQLYEQPPNSVLPGERPRVPLIYLAQQRHLERVKESLLARAHERYMEEHERYAEEEMLEEEEEEEVDPSLLLSHAPFNRGFRPMLSKITEMSERSDGTPYRPSKHLSVHLNAETGSATSVTESYGQVIEPTLAVIKEMHMSDPNTLTPSPTESARHFSSLYEPPPSPLSSVSRRTPIAQQASVSVPGTSSTPDISDSKSKSTHTNKFPASPSPSSGSTIPPPVPPKNPPKKQSKLSMLASSRSSVSAKTISTLTGGSMSDSSSVRTYSELRPTAKSLKVPSTVAPPSEPDFTYSASSSIARRVVDAALKLEMLDLEDESTSAVSDKTAKIRNPSPDKTPSSRQSERSESAGKSLRSLATERASTPQKLSSLSRRSKRNSSPEKPASSRMTEPNTVATKATSATEPVTTATKATSATEPVTAATKATSETRSPSPSLRGTAPSPTGTHRSASVVSSAPSTKAPSKLALLAQAKAKKANPTSALRELLDTPVASKGPSLPKPRTEYLMPVANGPTVTTAITTSYESFYTLTDPSRKPITTKTVSIEDAMTPQKTSKLASKTRRAIEKKEKEEAEYLRIQRELEMAEATPTISPSPLFLPQAGTIARTKASPSPFAALLVDDPDLKAKDAEREERRRRRKEKEKEKGRSAESSPEKEERRRRRKGRHSVPEPPSMPTTGGFAFDVPSPDDVVNRARKGTSLVKRHSAVAPPTKA